MSLEREQRHDKARKSEARKEFEEQENAGRFASGDADAQQARSGAEQKIWQVEGDRPSQWGTRGVIPEDALPPMDGSQPNNDGSEAQNISYTRNEGDTLSEGDVQHAINKANQGNS